MPASTLPEVFTALLRFSSSIVIAGVLVVAGCSKDGERPAPTCSRWEPGAAAGPGDVGLHFPFSPGNRWVSSVPVAPSEAWVSLEASGTRTVLGRAATTMAAFDLDTGAALGEVYRAVDSHGVVELGTDDASDTVTPALVPYYSARFPLAVGDEFTAVQCSNLDYGADLDGDGKNELLDVRLTVVVAAVEPVVTELATYPEAVRVQQTVAITLRASGSPQTATEEGRVTDWLAPGVGQVREAVEIPVGSQQTVRDLFGYGIGSVRKGLLARRLIGSGADVLHGPYGWAFDGERHVVVGARSGFAGSPARMAAIRKAPGGAISEPIDVLTGPSDLGLSRPGVAAGGGVVAILVSAWPTGEVLLQRLAPGGTLLEPASGKVIGTAASSWSIGSGPAIASDGTGFLGVWTSGSGGLVAARIEADGTKQPVEAAIDGCCAVTAFDGNQFLVVYQAGGGLGWGTELRAVHVNRDGVVVEATPLVLSSTGGAKHPIAMVFDGSQHVLLLADDRDGVSMSLTLRRMSPAGEWLDGDAATGGLVLLQRWAAINQASLYGESLTLDGATPVVAWATGIQNLPPVAGEEAWVMRLGPDGNPVDLHGPLPGVDTYLGDPMSCGGVTFPVALGGADGIPEVLYSVACDYPTYIQALRAVRFGL
jgi:hypothetical protein